MNTAEKIETVVLCWLQHRTETGTFGSIKSDGEHMIVRTDGKTFKVRTNRHGWEVRHGLCVSADPSLLEAASMVA